MSTTYYALIGSSNETGEDVRWSVTGRISENDVITLAEEECRITGEDLEFFAGFELIGSNKRAGSIGCEKLTWSRDWMVGEKFQASLLKLNDDGRTYHVFNKAKREHIEEFLTKAEAVGLRAEADALVAELSPEFFAAATGN